MSCRSSFASRGTLILASAALAIAMPLSSHAQGKAVGVIPDPRMPDSAQQAAMFAVTARMRSPAAMALSVKEELKLSPEQVAAIEALVPIEADSGRVRMERMMASTRQSAKAPGWSTAWTGPIDEAAVRAAACEQARTTADMMIGMMRDRHALGVLLTPDQQQQFDRLQGQMMMRIMRPVINK
jgi:hypothetical protein